MIYFATPNGDVFVTDGIPAEKYVAKYPEGTKEIPAPPSPDHDWDGTDWVYVERFTLAERKALAVSNVVARHAKMLVKLSGDYSSEERETWLLQLEWARGFIVDQNTTHAVLLSGMFATSPTGNVADDAQLMADKIIGKSAAYAKLVMLSQRTKAQALAAIEAAETPEQLATTMTDLTAIEAAAIVELTQEEDTP